MAALIAAQGKALEETPLDAMESAWGAVKLTEKE